MGFVSLNEGVNGCTELSDKRAGAIVESVQAGGDSREGSPSGRSRPSKGRTLISTWGKHDVL